VRVGNRRALPPAEAMSMLVLSLKVGEAVAIVGTI
jgi:hypothetical protein